MKIPFLFTLLAASSLAAEKPNVLFIAVDDLKPMLSCYGDKDIKTPHFDRLAERSTVFLNAHCQQAVCGPSRASLMTGLRPDTIKVWDLKTRIRDITPDVVTLPQYFKDNGYEAVGIGKTYDPRSVDGYAKNDPASWSRPYLMPKPGPENEMGYLDPEFVNKARAIKDEQGAKGDGWNSIKKVLGGTPATEGNMDVPDDAYDDGVYASKAIEMMGELSQTEKPFFLAVGFKKPHLPFVAPKKYWDLYQREEISLAAFQEMPKGAPAVHFQDSWELKNGSYQGYKGLEGLLPEDKQRELIHGYMACVSYIDAQLGRLLDALDQSTVADNTIIVLWGDHGWHLGDHGMWCKHTNYEQSTRSPLIIAQAGGKNGGQKSNSPVEFTDIYPTLCDLAGLEIPEVLEGKSLTPILENPEASIRGVATSQYPRGGGNNQYMGYSHRDTRYRLVQWFKGQDTSVAPEFTELYDYEKDPLEKVNLADNPEYAETLTRLQAEAKAFHN